jgi:hypothetical protein
MTSTAHKSAFSDFAALPLTLPVNDRMVSSSRHTCCQATDMARCCCTGTAGWELQAGRLLVVLLLLLVLLLVVKTILVVLVMLVLVVVQESPGKVVATRAVATLASCRHSASA